MKEFLLILYNCLILKAVSQPAIIFKCLQFNLEAFFFVPDIGNCTIIVLGSLLILPAFLCQSVQQFNKTIRLLKYPEPLQHYSLLLLDFFLIIFFIKTPAIINIPLELKVAQLGAKAQLKHHVFLQDSAFMIRITIEIYSTNPWVGWGCV